MPRDGNGNYTLPLPPVVADTTIESNVENSTNTDLAQALTDSLSRSGSGGMQTQLKIVDGNSADPGLQFNSETQSGLYRASAGDNRYSVLNQDIWRGTLAGGFEYWDEPNSMWRTPVSQVEFTDLDTKVDTLDAQNVKLTGAQSVDGVKTFVQNVNVVKGGAISVKAERTDGTPGKVLMQVSGSNARLTIQNGVTNFHDLEVDGSDRLGFRYNGVVHSYWDDSDGGWNFGTNTVLMAGVLTLETQPLVSTTGNNAYINYKTDTSPLGGYAGMSGAGNFVIWNLEAGGDIVFGTNDTARVAITEIGRFNFSTDLSAEGFHLISTGAFNDLVMESPDASDSRILFRGSSALLGDLSFDNTTQTFVFKTNSSSRMQIEDAGNVLIFNLAGAGNRAVYSDANGRLTNSASDASLKTNLAPISQGLAEVLTFNPISYNWIDTERFGAQNEIGFTAQEMEAVVPEVVGMNSDDTKTIDYPRLVAVLTRAIQELEARVAALEP